MSSAQQHLPNTKQIKTFGKHLELYIRNVIKIMEQYKQAELPIFHHLQTNYKYTQNLDELQRYIKQDSILESIVFMIRQILHKIYNKCRSYIQQDSYAIQAKDGTKKCLFSLKLQIQFFNMNKNDPREYIEFQDILITIFNCLKQIKSQGQCNKEIALYIYLLNCQSQNVSDKVLSTIKNYTQNQQKTRIHQYKNEQNFCDVLSWIKQNKKKQIQVFSNPFVKSNCRSQAIVNRNNTKHKQICKTRTIYYSRKNIFNGRKTQAQITQKSIYSNKSTQWSGSVVSRVSRDFNHNYCQDILVGKTPKPSKAIFFQNNRPIDIKINFFD